MGQLHEARNPTKRWRQHAPRCRDWRGAIEALGDNQSTEAQWLTSALNEACRAAQERPTAIQVEECQTFIQRSQNRVADGAGLNRRTEGARRSHCSVDRRHEQSAVSRTHTARCDASASRSFTDKASRIASPRRRDGGGEGRVPQETRKIPFRPFPTCQGRRRSSIQEETNPL